MSRNSEYEFVPTDTDAIVAELVSAYEQETGETPAAASPEMLIIRWVASVLIQHAVKSNYIGNQNLPSRAYGENLDTLGEELYNQTKRSEARAAICTERFYISEPQNTSIVIPAGTRVTDAFSSMYFETTEDALVPIGETYVDVQIRCRKVGIEGNGYEVGRINSIVDLFDYYLKCENITVSDSGADESTDEEYYELLRESQDGYSCAGPIGAYIYFAKKVSTEIADVCPNVPSGGCVAIYVLMKDGSLASEEIKKAVVATCTSYDKRPMTDFVNAVDAEFVEYNIEFTYYTKVDSTVSASDVESKVHAAVNEYVEWQHGKFGRDINPDELRKLLYQAGVKRIVPSEPSFVPLRDGKDNTVPQVAKIGNIIIINGGYEDE